MLCQKLEIQDFNNNNGFVTIKIGEVDIIRKYTKVLHVINITEYENAKEHIKENIKIIQGGNVLPNPMLNTISHNFKILENKITNLKPHLRQKRGLLNAVGTGLKYLVGTMDSNDEIEIRNKLEALSDNSKKLIVENNKQVIFNNHISEQITNITKHIRNQQEAIKLFLDKFNSQSQNTIIELEHEINYVQQMYQINYDINLLKDHLENIEEIILTSKLGILSRNILTEQEMLIVKDITNFRDIKIVVAFQSNQIIIILFIPEHSEIPYSRILIEPIPNKENKTLHIKKHVYLMDQFDKIYNENVKDSLKRNLIEVNDKCITGIMSFQETKCVLEKFYGEEIKEIISGIVITKNIKKSRIIHNCNNYNVTVEGTNIIRFKNCRISIKGELFENTILEAQDHIILPHFTTRIIANRTINTIEFEDFHEYTIKNNRKQLEFMAIENKNNNIINWSINTIIIVIILTTIILILYKKYVKETSSEPQSNDGGVIHEDKCTHKHKRTQTSLSNNRKNII